MRHFKNVIVRIPGKGISEGITSNPQLGKPVYENALVQHEHYVEALAKCGVQVNVLPPNNDFPDSCFMEDTALCTTSVQSFHAQVLRHVVMKHS